MDIANEKEMKEWLFSHYVLIHNGLIALAESEDACAALGNPESEDTKAIIRYAKNTRDVAAKIVEISSRFD
jgi:hypothetical protein